MASRLEQQDITMDVTDAALAEIATVGFDPLYGARPLKRAIQDHVENALSRKLLAGEIKPKNHVCVDCENQELVFRVSDNA